MAKQAPTDKPATFEEALGELETITRRMESGEATLDESLSLYETGTRLVEHCQAQLDAAEQKIEELSKGGDGRLRSDTGRDA